MLRLIVLCGCIGLLGVSASCAAEMPAPTPLPTAGTILEQILADCWNVKQLRELDGTRPDHTRAFECARVRLLALARQYPDAAESHRLLAWGYYFTLQDENAARAEYERAAQIYGAQGRALEQAEMLVQLASLAFKYDQTRGCALLLQALALDTTNVRAAQLLRNFGCLVPTPVTTPTAAAG
ncbi:hypothetical protein FBQ82_15420 [Anaerolineae bacterium CFX7]|nr:hypothetical protein [Anaerolineae bacterium CFX7]